MPLIEALILGIGNGVARGVVKLWLRDAKILEETSLSVLDMIRTKTTDVLAQRASEHQFQLIAEHVAGAVGEVFDRDGVGLDESAKVSVAKAVEQILEDTPLSSLVLPEVDLSPQRLAELYLASASSKGSADPRRSFSEAETGLFERALSEAAQYIVDIAAQMPSVNQATFAEVLRREGALLQKADLILTEVRRMRPRLPQSQFEQKCRDYVYSRMQETIERLREVRGCEKYYVEPTVLDGHRRIALAENADDIATSPNRRIVLSADSGFGKTVFLMQYYVRHAKRFVENVSTVLPFWFRVAELQSTRKTLVDFLVDKVFGERDEFEGFDRTEACRLVAAKLDGDGILMLLDGLDQSRQDLDLARVLGHEAGMGKDPFGGSRVVITSRPRDVRLVGNYKVLKVA